MTARDSAKAVRDQIALQVQEEEEGKQIAEQKIRNELMSVKNDASLALLYQQNAKLGSENLGAELPQLKIHTTNKSIGHELADGSEPHNGWFFYKPTQEQFQTLDVHILAISKGYRAEGYQGKKDVFHQILAGIIADGSLDKPFIMYFSGTKLSHLWEFGKEAGKYTRNKELPIPMFALKVRLSVDNEVHANGSSFVVKFEILKTSDGFPMIVQDEGTFVFLRDHANDMVFNLQKLADKKAKTDKDGVVTASTEPDDYDPEQNSAF